MTTELAGIAASLAGLLVLVAHVGVAFWAAGRSTRRRYGAFAPAIVTLLYPVWVFALTRFVPATNPTLMIVGSAVVPSLVLAAATIVAFRHAVPTLGALIAGPVASAAMVVFERGTHGPWYIQSEAIAMALTLAIGETTWFTLATGSLVLWRARLARFRTGCAGCGYDVRGLAPDAPCPECGSTARAITLRPPRD